MPGQKQRERHKPEEEDSQFPKPPSPLDDILKDFVEEQEEVLDQEEDDGE
ncbi:MAG: hypothetical protein AAB897_00845 [Patescibacteria group bacterium]